MKADEIIAEEEYVDPLTERLDQYDETLGDNQPWVSINEIVVPTERDKEQLLAAFEYIHNLREIDPNFMAVNSIMHMYQCPDKIKVEPK